MNFDLTEEQKDLKEILHKYATEVLAPRAVEIDKNNRFPKETIKELAEQDLMGIAYPEEYGGAGADSVTEAIAVEEIAYGCGATASILTGHYLGFDALYLAGTPEQKEEYLKPACLGEKLAGFALTEPGSGSDAGASSTIATEDGDAYVLNGTKHFITNAADADFLIAFAMTDKPKKTHGMTAFIVPKGTPGFSIGAGDDKMGIRGGRTWEVIFDHCRIPKKNIVGEINHGFKLAMQVIDRGRTGIAAMSVGIAQAALDMAVSYAKERIVFGERLADFQGLRWMLAEMEADVEAARYLTYYASSLKDKHIRFSKQAACAKLFAAEAAHRVVDKALQIYGGYGYMKEYPIERLYRDQRITEIFEGTSQIQKIVIAGQLLK